MSWTESPKVGQEWIVGCIQGIVVQLCWTLFMLFISNRIVTGISQSLQVTRVESSDTLVFGFVDAVVR